MVETREIVFLGGSYAGLSATHYFLKHVYPHLPHSPTIRYKVVLINASPKFYQKHASPRAIANPALMPNEKIFLDIEPGFKQYGDQVQFLAAKATSWDPKERVLYLIDNSGQKVTRSYYALVLATGSKTSSLTQSSYGNSHEEIQTELAVVSSQVKTANSIIIAGGGPAGVETAGEVAEFLNGAPGWFQSHPPEPRASIILVTSANKLLPSLRPSIAKQAERDLSRLGVEVKYNTKVTSVTRSSNNSGKQAKVGFSDGTELFTDVYLPATGTIPLSSYVPSHLLDSFGRVLTNESTLRVVPEAGPRTYAIGDITCFTMGGLAEIQLEVPVLASNMKRDLLIAHSGRDDEIKYHSNDRIYVPERRELQLVPIGTSRGVGAIWGWRLPSIAVWLIKGRDYMVGSGVDKVFGKSEAKEVKWTAEQQTI